jgi:hypothetical protein
MSRSQPLSFLVLDQKGEWDLSHDGLQVGLRKVTAKAARVIGYYAFSKSALLERIREEGITMTTAAQRWLDGMPSSLRGWNPAQTDDGGVVVATAI